MCFSHTHWPQLTAPFYSILFETSICQFNSTTFSPIIPDEVREYLKSDQRPFLHPEWLQTFQIPSSMTVLLLFSSPHSCSTGFRSEDWKQKLGFVLSDPFLCCFLRFVFGFLYGWKIQTCPIIIFITESVAYWFFTRWYFTRWMPAVYLFNSTHGVLFIPVFAKPILSVCC